MPKQTRFPSRLIRMALRVARERPIAAVRERQKGVIGAVSESLQLRKWIYEHLAVTVIGGSVIDDAIKSALDSWQTGGA